MKKPKSDKQRQTTGKARPCSQKWTRLLEGYSFTIFALVSSLEPAVREKYNAMIARAKGYRSKKKYLALWMIMLDIEKIIEPTDEIDIKDKSTFCGWKGFKVLNSGNFHSALKEISFYPDGQSMYKADTIRGFFRDAMNMKPSNWVRGFLGLEPFAFSKPENRSIASPSPQDQQVEESDDALPNPTQNEGDQTMDWLFSNLPEDSFAATTIPSPSISGSGASTRAATPPASPHPALALAASTAVDADNIEYYRSDLDGYDPAPYSGASPPVDPYVQTRTLTAELCSPSSSFSSASGVGGSVGGGGGFNVGSDDDDMLVGLLPYELGVS